MQTRLGSSALLALLVAPCLSAQTTVRHPVIFQQPGFPTVASEPVSPGALREAIPGATLADLQQLRSGQALAGASLLVLPYGSAVPTAAWAAIHDFLQKGGNLLIIGGQPLHVPVEGDHAGGFTPQAPQDSYSRELGLLHTYAAPMPAGPTHFAWRNGYDFLPRLTLQPTTVFVEEGHLNGLGYLDAADGTHLASPIVWSDHLGTERMNGSRVVMLPIAVPTVYWDSADGKALLRTAAHYAEAGATSLQAELQYTALRPGESPALTLHLHQAATTPADGTARVELREGDRLLTTQNVPLGGRAPSVPVSFSKPLPAGVYTLRAIWTPSGGDAKQPQEFAENGFVVEDLSSLASGPALGTHGDFLTLGGKPFLPVGTNYFSTDANGWDFSGPRNGATWDRDFADMERHGVTFVRTGVWMPSFARFVEGSTGEANERFLRNLEAFLSAAHRHNIAVNFTCFAFTPHGQDRGHRSSDATPGEPLPGRHHAAAGAGLRHLHRPPLRPPAVPLLGPYQRALFL